MLLAARLPWAAARATGLPAPPSLTSRSIRGGWLIDVAMGGLNYQIEHHVFSEHAPSQPAPGQTDRASVLADRGISYMEVSLFASYGIVVRYLNDVGMGRATPSLSFQQGLPRLTGAVIVIGTPRAARRTVGRPSQHQMTVAHERALNAALRRGEFFVDVRHRIGALRHCPVGRRAGCLRPSGR